MRRLLTTLTVVLAVLAVAGPAAGHVTVQPTEALVGSFARFVVRVPNERPDASTIEVEVQLPPLAFVNFQDVAGWERTVEMTTLDEPLEVFGEEITEVAGSVRWSGGEIEPAEFQEFGFSARMPDAPATLEFPAIQTYDSGEVVRWIGPPDAETPAALLHGIDIGAGEGENQLAVLAEVAAKQEALAKDAGSGDLGVILGWIGIGLGGLALALTLLRRRA
jgi:uncharacterized protein YcnI